MNKVRDSRFEVIRIISMLFIILCHFSLYGNWENNLGGINRFKTMLFHPLGQIGVYLFVFISAYFLSPRKLNLQKQINRVKKLWIKTIFYSWIILIFAFIFKFPSLGLKNVIISIFPISFNEYWFMTAFIILMLFLKPVNNLIIRSNKKELMFYIFVLLYFGNFMNILRGDASPLGVPTSCCTLFSSYFVAAYIKKYDINLKVIYSVILIIIGLIFEYTGMFILRNKYIIKFNFGVFPLLVTVGIFLLFLKLKPFYSRIINWIASGVLASYLITEQPVFRLYFWHNLLNVRQFQNPTWLFIVAGIIISLVTILVCSIIDHGYQWGSKKIRSLIKA